MKKEINKNEEDNKKEKKLVHIVDGDKIPESKIRISLKLMVSLVVGIFIVASIGITKYYSVENALNSFEEDLKDFKEKISSHNITELNTKHIITSAFDAECKEIDNTLRILNIIKSEKKCGDLIITNDNN